MRKAYITKYVSVVCIAVCLAFCGILYKQEFCLQDLLQYKREGDIKLVSKLESQNIALSLANGRFNHPKLMGCHTVIHASVICTEGYELQQIETLMKSILLHRKYTLHFHFVVTKASLKILKILFETWRLPDVEVFFYLVEDLADKILWDDESTFSEGNGISRSKFILPDILPKNLTHVIALDPAVLFSSDISELWFHFRDFENAEAIGVAEEQTDSYFNMENKNGDSTSATDKNHLRYSTALMLLNLDKLRQRAAGKTWKSIISSRVHVENTLRVRLTPHNIMNMILDEHSDIVRTIPCFWNLHISNNITSSLCYTQHSRHIKAVFINEANRAELLFNRFPLLKTLIESVVDMDGNLVRLPSLKCNINQEYEETSPLIVPKPSNPCNSIESGVYRTHLFFLPFEYTPASNYDVSIVLHLSFDRISMLEKICTYWKGPVSAAILINDFEVKALISFVQESTIFKDRKDIGYHLAYKNSKIKSYHINLLRNIALSNAVTEYVFLCDVDFVPRRGLNYRLQRYLSSTKERGLHAYVIPAFETYLSELKIPTSKSALLQNLVDGTITPFHAHKWPVAHKPTNFEKWKSTNKSYSIAWAPFFEPYVVIRKQTCPPYDPRFLGYGFNKITHIAELDAMGFNFKVLPLEFIIHLPHATSKEKVRYRTELQYKKCVDYLRVDFLRKLLKANGQTTKYDFMQIPI